MDRRACGMGGKESDTTEHVGKIADSGCCIAAITQCYKAIILQLKKKVRVTPVHFSQLQSLSRVQLFATPWTTARQASLSITNSWSLLKLMSIEAVMSSNHLILCRPFLLPPSIFLSIRVFSNESALRIR